MSVPPIPPQFELLTHRPFSFYPAILNVKHNEWLIRRTTWSEILVVNCKTGLEVWVPRRFVGEVSRIDEPVMIVGLLKELEYKGGSVWPHERRVIEMPVAVNQGPRGGQKPQAESPALVVGIRFEPGPESRVSRLIGAALLGGVLLVLLLVALAHRPVSFLGVEQTELGLTAEDDYHSIVRKLGAPADDRWKPDSGEIQYRVLEYADPPMSVVLMGADRESARYIGALDGKWRPIHSVQLPDGSDMRPMLRGLRRF
jgi:hypothetical protein